MRKSNFSSFDLNLMKVLVEIDRQGSVSGAAQALGVGQPAVSQSLSRLRQTLSDQLFVRGEGGMVATPKLQSMIGPIRAAMGQIEESVFGPQEFDAATDNTRFLLGASDYAASLTVPPILAQLRATIPHADLSVRPCDRTNHTDLLMAGDIDLAIGLFPETQVWLRRRRLFRDRHVCVFNSELLDLPERLTLRDYAAQDHLLVSLDGSPTGFVDEILAKTGLKRRVTITTPFFLQAAFMLERLPVLATLPERFVSRVSNFAGMEQRPLPFQTPELTISAVWRASDERNPKQAALRDVIFGITDKGLV